jgi:hypothetical protein
MAGMTGASAAGMRAEGVASGHLIGLFLLCCILSEELWPWRRKHLKFFSVFKYLNAVLDSSWNRVRISRPKLRI